MIDSILMEGLKNGSEYISVQLSTEKWVIFKTKDVTYEYPYFHGTHGWGENKAAVTSIYIHVNSIQGVTFSENYIDLNK